MNADEFRKHGHAVIDWIAEYLETVERRPVLSQVRPGAIRRRVDPRPPENPTPFDELLRDVDAVVMDGLTHWQSPNFFAFFPANNSYPSILGELLSAGLGVQGMMWITSPACTELEMAVLDGLVEALGLPAAFCFDAGGGGVIQDSASSALLCALVAARERATAGAANRLGARQPLVAYASNQAHSSFLKGARIAGLGEENVRFLDVDSAFRLRPDALEEAIRSDRRNGRIPAFVCATYGTTASLAMDPLRAIGDICRREGVWLHVDGAMAGSAAICPEFRHFQDGLELADSYCFNPHKWMLVNFDCTCFWVVDRRSLTSALSVLPHYLRNPATDSGEVIDYRDWQAPLGRRFRALKLWFTLRSFGLEAIRTMIRRHVGLAREFAAWVAADERFELADDVRLNLVCFRHRGGDAINEELLNALNASGAMYVTHAELNGKLTLRWCVGQARTERRHVEAAWRRIQSTAPTLESAPGA